MGQTGSLPFQPSSDRVESSKQLGWDSRMGFSLFSYRDYESTHGEPTQTDRDY